MQNIPIRSELVSDSGEVHHRAGLVVPVGRLFAGGTLRILAHITQDETLLRTFRGIKDIHAYGCSNHDTHRERDENQRRFAKTINFGLIYGWAHFGWRANRG